MSNELYTVEVLDLKRSKVSILLTINDGDQGLPVTSSWALMMLHEATWTGLEGKEPKADRAKRKESALAKRMEGVDVDAFCKEHGADFVPSVTLSGERNYPIDDPEEYNEKHHAKHERLRATGRYELVVGDARWLAHLGKGMRWHSTSYGETAERPRTKTATIGPILKQLGAAKAAERRKGLKAVVQLATRDIDTLPAVLGTDAPTLTAAICDVLEGYCAKRVWNDDILTALEALAYLELAVPPSRIRPILETLLAHHDGSDIRSRVSRVLCNSTLVDECMPVIVQLAAHANESIREDAITNLALADTRRREAKELLRKLLKDTVPAVRKAAKDALAKRT